MGALISFYLKGIYYLVPAMLLDVSNSVLLVTQSLGGVLPTVYKQTCKIVINAGFSPMMVLPAEPLDDGKSSLGDVPRKLELIDSSQDDVVDLHRVRGSEGWPDIIIHHNLKLICVQLYCCAIHSRSGKELAHEHSERPEVDRSVVALVQDDLWRDVLWSAAEGPGLAALWDALGEAKVHHLDEALRVQQQVLGLQIAVDDATAMQVVWKVPVQIFF